MNGYPNTAASIRRARWSRPAFPSETNRFCLATSRCGLAIERFEDLRRAGAAALDLAWTASSTFDGFFELSLNTWDVAAGALLVLEVGGRVTDWSGGDTWLESGNILAAAPAVHDVLLELAAKSHER